VQVEADETEPDGAPVIDVEPAAAELTATPESQPQPQPRATAPTARRQPGLSAKGLDDGQSHSNQQLQYSAPTLDSAEAGPVSDDPNTTTVTGTEPARNAPCPCGSGKKYKRCHGAPSRS
jgi:preprotein translocase subunit SecA